VHVGGKTNGQAPKASSLWLGMKESAATKSPSLRHGRIDRIVSNLGFGLYYNGHYVVDIIPILLVIASVITQISSSLGG